MYVFFDKIYQVAIFCNTINKYPNQSLIYGQVFELVNNAFDLALSRFVVQNQLYFQKKKNLNYPNSPQFSLSKSDFLKLIRCFFIRFSRLKKTSKIWLQSNALFILRRRLTFAYASQYRYASLISICSFHPLFLYMYAL